MSDEKMIECFVDVQIEGQVHRIKIRHNKDVEDAEIFVDEKETEVKYKGFPGGGALFFECSDTEVIITIIKNGQNYDYDCFIDGKSVQNEMPWKMGKYDLPAVLKWKKKIELGMGKYVMTEGLKGLIIGCVLFIILFVINIINSDLLGDGLSMYIYLPLCLVPITAIYAAFSPAEFKAGKKSVEIYNSFKNPAQEETAQTEASETEESEATEVFDLDLNQDSEEI